MKVILYKDTKLFAPMRYVHDNLIQRFTNQSYEQEEESMIKKHITEDDRVLEIGTCLGYTTALLSKRAKSVTSVEANPELTESLISMKKANKLDNVELVHGYLSNTKEEVEFQTYDNIVAGSGDREDLEINNVRGWGETLKTYQVKCVKIEDLPGYKEFNSMCLDLEGGELGFLEENVDYISQNISKMILEIHGHLMKDPAYNIKVFDMLKKAGFEDIEMRGVVLYCKK